MEKIIHYCWFGEGEKPKLTQKCIETWKKFLPDYKIIEWNEKNFDVGCCRFVKEAYEARNFAFVSDYARAKALYENGGIYFDTDVEVLKSFDRFLSDEFFVGFEEKAFVGTCVMGAQKGAPILKEYMSHYENAAYLNEDGTKYSDTNVLLLTRLLEEKGLERNDKEQTVDGYIKIYPRTFFSPYDYINGINYITDDSYSIHHFTLSWLPKSTRIKTGIKRKIIKIIGGENIKKIREKLG